MLDDIMEEIYCNINSIMTQAELAMKCANTTSYVLAEEVRSELRGIADIILGDCTMIKQVLNTLKEDVINETK